MIPGGPISGWLGGAPQSQRFLVDIVKSLGELAFDEQVDALRKSPRAVKELCFLAYSFHELYPSPEVVESLGPVAPRVETATAEWARPMKGSIEKSYEGRPGNLREHYESGNSGDLLFDEAERRLVKLFCVGIKPGLSNEKRDSLFGEICGRLRADEVELLHGIFAHRAIPGVTRKAATLAFPGFLETKRPPEIPEGPRYDWSMYPPMADIRDQVASAPAPRSTMPAPEKTAAQKYYESLYSKIVFPL
jgi:hypothetical protein